MHKIDETAFIDTFTKEHPFDLTISADMRGSIIFARTLMALNREDMRKLQALLGQNTHPDVIAIADEVHTTLKANWNASRSIPIKERFRNLVSGAQDVINNIQTNTSHPIPCAAGCSSCCSSQEIIAWDFEVEAIVDFIEKTFDSEDKQAFLNRLAAFLSTAKALHKPRSPCVFLVQGSCSIHKVRPLACRAYLSTSKRSCDDYLSVPGAPMPKILMAPEIVANVFLAVSGAHKKQKFHEINTAMRLVYDVQQKRIPLQLVP